MNINNINDFNNTIKHEPYHGNPILPYSQDNDFKELYDYFKNKTVAIVGPSPDLITQNKGVEIDKHDIVCHVGSMLNMNDNKYGSRVDVLFNGCFPDIYDINHYKQKKINRLICPIKPCMPGIRDVHNRDIWKQYNYLKNNLPEIKFNNTGILSCKFDNLYNTRATIGTFSIYLLLNMPIKSLSIYGFTWYNTPYHPNYGQKFKGGTHGVPLSIEKEGIKKTIKTSNIKVYLNDEVKKSLYM